MIESRLENQLGALERAVRNARLLNELAACWSGAAAVGILFFLLHRFANWNLSLLWLLIVAATFTTAAILWLRHQSRPANFRALAALIERDHPELKSLLRTAVEQEPDSGSGEFTFLQLRVLAEAIAHREQETWGANLKRQFLFSQAVHFAAVVAFLAMLVSVGQKTPVWQRAFGVQLADKVTVTPGDVSVERGNGLVIAARFDGRIPAEAALVVVSASGKNLRIPLARHLADPVFGASLPEVKEDGLYHVEYGAEKTPDFKISVFDYPALVRADAALEFPRYTGLTNKMIPDTRRISAVEGSRVTYTLQLNKPVVKARLVSKEQTLALEIQSNAVALLNNFTLTNSARYSLELVDADGRSNKLSTEFFVQALPNKRPDLKLSFPRGDQRVSSLEEMQLQAEATDDFGLVKYGIGFNAAGQEPELAELGQSASANEKRAFTNLISLESLKAEVGEVVSYFAWADDYGSDGETRRTYSDMFFAEVRPFEEKFRADQSGGGDEENSQNQPGGGGGGGNETVRLADLQKQIILATWKLQREKHPGAKKP